MSLFVQLKIVGLLLFVLGLAHALFPSRFAWKTELENISLLTRQIFYVHHFFVALVVGLLGALCLFWTDAVLQPSPLGRVFLGGVTLFWACRLAIQFVFFDASHWRGHRFNTRIHILFALLWLYLIAVFGASWLHQLGAIAVRPS